MRRWQVIILALALVLVTAIGAYSDFTVPAVIPDTLAAKLEQYEEWSEGNIWVGDAVHFPQATIVPIFMIYSDNVSRVDYWSWRMFCYVVGSWEVTDRPILMPQANIRDLEIKLTVGDNTGLNIERVGPIKPSEPGVFRFDLGNATSYEDGEAYYSLDAYTIDNSLALNQSIDASAEVSFTMSCGGYVREYELTLPFTYIENYYPKALA